MWSADELRVERNLHLRGVWSVMDRDLNAAKNILARALLSPDVSAGWSARKRRGEQGKTSGKAKVISEARATIRERKGVCDAST